MAELGGAAAVGDPGGLAELVQAVVAGGVPDLRVAAGLTGDHTGPERATGVGSAGVVAGRRGGRGLHLSGDRRGARVPRRVGLRAELCGRARDVGGLRRDGQHLPDIDVVGPANLATVAVEDDRPGVRVVVEVPGDRGQRVAGPDRVRAGRCYLV